MKSFLTVIAISALCLLTTSCDTSTHNSVKGGGPVKSETLTLPAGGFEKISISVPADAHITLGGAAGLREEGYANVLSLLRTEVANNTLRIFLKDDVDLSTDKDVRMDISLPALTGLEFSGSGTVTVENAVKAQDFTLNSSGAGTISFADLQLQSFRAEMNVASDLVLKSGAIGEGDYKLAGSGSLSAFPVAQQSVKLRIAGAGSAEVQAVSKLDASISGAGSVRYKGHPAVTQDIKGVGSIEAAN